MAAASPTLLTPEDAAVIARCSIKTVGRAYATAVLTAYRRRGSRAVLLDNRGVLAWVRGEVVQPTARSTPALESKPAGSARQKSARRVDETVRAEKLGSQQRFDVSSDALRDRRNSKTESLR
jgi:hypothetical protein